MTALAQERGANLEAISRLPVTLTGVKAWKGAKIALNLSTGKAVLAAANVTAPLLVIGCAHETVDATAADKELDVVLDREIWGRWQVNSGVTAVVAADIGRLCYQEDDQTVCADPVAGQPVAGRVWQVSSTRGVFVELLLSPGPSPLVGHAPAPVAGDVILLANPPPGAVIDVPTTAAATTVTLPATAIEGTAIDFVADGTKNGHTVQYRDATGPTNLTTALLASKRHLVRCAFLGGKWHANAYVAP